MTGCNLFLINFKSQQGNGDTGQIPTNLGKYLVFRPDRGSLLLAQWVHWECVGHTHSHNEEYEQPLYAAMPHSVSRMEKEKLIQLLTVSYWREGGHVVCIVLGTPS